jgi:hypothetical protein
MRANTFKIKFYFRIKYAAPMELLGFVSQLSTNITPLWGYNSIPLGMICL